MINFRSSNKLMLISPCLLTVLGVSACAKKHEKTLASLEIIHDSKRLVSYSFGQLDFGAKETLLLTLRNSGESSAEIDSLIVKDAQGNSLTSLNYVGGVFPGTSGTCQTSIGPESECTIALEYTAPKGTAYTSTTEFGTATITYNNSKGIDNASTGFTATYRKCAAGSVTSLQQNTIDTGSAATVNNANFIVAQSVQFSTTTLIKKVTLSQAKYQNATLSHVKLYFFNGGSPVGSLISSEEFADPGLIESSRKFFTYTLSEPVAVTENSPYVIGVSYVAPSGNITTDKQTTDAYAGGNYLYSNNGGSTWTSVSGQDLTFSVETCVADVVEAPSATY